LIILDPRFPPIKEILIFLWISKGAGLVGIKNPIVPAEIKNRQIAIFIFRDMVLVF
jgi:hypothetical protein